MSDPSDAWVAASTYEAFMGRWSRRLVPRFVAWLPVAPGARWLDVGCGTGALVEAIAAAARPAAIVGCDPSEAFIGEARRRHVDPRVSFLVAGVGDLPTCAGGFDSVTSALALNFFPDPRAAIDEMRRVAAPGGLVSACVWDYAGRMEFLRRFWDAAAAIDPSARRLDEGQRFPICNPAELASIFRTCGLADVVCDGIEITTRFVDFDDYWLPFLGGTGPAPSYVAGLAADPRDALADRLRRTLPRQRDGAIALVANAWAVRGRAH